MSLLKSAILLGAAMVLMPAQGVFAHGTKQHGAETATGGVASIEGADTNIVVTIDPGSPVAEVVRVTRGAFVHMTVFGAGASEMHLHGYDIEVTGEPGQPALFVFDASHTGRFPLEVHVEDDLLGSSEKAVLYIEVREQ